MKEKVNEIKSRIKIDLNVDDLNILNDIKTKYIGKKGIITELSSMLKEVPSEERKSFGMMLNEVKTLFNDTYESKKQELEEALINKKLESEKVDVTLPETDITIAPAHMVERVIEDLEEFFISMGYQVVEGPEVEKDLYNFELLNLPKGHPARDAQDTFYLQNDEILLRSQTSPVQVRTMLANQDKTPIRIICPGKTYRRDYDDASHGHQFTQIEGLVVDKDISLAHLKGTLDAMARHMFGPNCVTRFRPSFYPFTEPSVEYDMSCFNCGGKGCNVCKNTGWVTIGGAGIVHPNVLKNCGYDNEVYTGFAFGFGVERMTMLKYGINDLRVLYTNDLRSLDAFRRKDV